MPRKSKSGRALGPDEIKASQRLAIPPEVFDVFNELLAKNLSGNQAIVKQDEVVAMLVERLAVSRQTIFDNHWLNVESFYRHQGWLVDYDKPGYGESYEAYFRFQRRRPLVPKERRP